jgi:hypothetical protein
MMALEWIRDLPLVFIRGTKRLPLDQRATDGGFASKFAVDRSGAMHLYRIAAPCNYFHFDPKLVTRDNHLAKLGALDAGKNHQLMVAVRDLRHEQRAAGLGHGFYDQHPGHDGVAGEVSIEVRLVDADILEGNNALFRVDLDDPVDQQEGISMRQQRLDLRDAQRPIVTIRGRAAMLR